MMDVIQARTELAAAFKRSAVAALHVDLQGFYLSGPPARRGYNTVNKLASECRAAGVPNFWAAISYRCAILPYETFQKDNHKDLSGISDLIHVDPEEIVFEKDREALFCIGNLKPAILLKSHQVDTLVITGVMHHVCVALTAKTAVERGFKVCVVADATDRPDYILDGYENFLKKTLHPDLRPNLSVVYADNVLDALPKRKQPSLFSKKSLACFTMGA